MKKLTKTKLLPMLMYVKYDAATNPKQLEDGCGICFHVNQKFFRVYPELSHVDVYKALAKLFVGWDKHSGNRSYPIIPSSTIGGLRWDGEVLKLRLDLLDYTINKVRNMTAAEFNKTIKCR